VGWGSKVGGHQDVSASGNSDDAGCRLRVLAGNRRLMTPAADHATEHERDPQIEGDRQQQGAATAMTPRLVSASTAAPTSPSHALSSKPATIIPAAIMVTRLSPARWVSNAASCRWSCASPAARIP